MTTREDFLTRWARRKAEAKTEPHPAADESPPPAPAALPAAEAEANLPAAPPEPDMLRDAPPDEETRAEWISKLEAVDLDTLNYKDDFTVFMRNWVPQALRNRALKRLWRTSEVFEVLDGLNDYDEDFSDAATIIGEIKTSWKLGRGFADVEVEAEGEVEAMPDETAEASAGEPEAGSDDAQADDDEGAASENVAAAAKNGKDEDVG